MGVRVPPGLHSLITERGEGLGASEQPSLYLARSRSERAAFATSDRLPASEASRYASGSRRWRGKCGERSKSERAAFATSDRLPASEASRYASGSRRWREPLAVSSRGLGRSPLKAQTRVRIPLPLLRIRARSSIGSGRHPFTVQRRVRLPYGLLWEGKRMGVT